MALKSFSEGVCIAVYLFTWFCGAIHADQPEDCFLYPVENGTLSPEYELRDNYETYVTINNLFNNKRSSVVDENDTCIVCIDHSDDNACQDQGCMTDISSEAEYTALVFRNREGELSVYKRDSMEHEVHLASKAKSIMVLPITAFINVAFNCPSNCFEFENATIHKSAQQEENDLTLKMYGKVTDLEKANNSKIKIMRGENWGKHKYSWLKDWNITSADQEDQWFYVDISASFGDEEYKEGFSQRLMKVYITTPFLLKPDNHSIGVISKDLYLNFKETSGMRWAVFCRPFDKKSSILPGSTVSSNPSVSPPGTSTSITRTTSSSETETAPKSFFEGKIKILYLIIAAGFGVFFFVLAMLLCVYICCKRRQRALHLPKPSNNGHLDTTNVLDTTDMENDDHVYDYIDMEAFHKQMKETSAPSKQSKTKDEICEDTAYKRNSHTSINSVYGYTGKAESPAADSNGQRTSHTSINSLYGYTGKAESPAPDSDGR